MPHQCTNCGEIYSDGAEEILSGCPKCDWNKFMYLTEIDQVELNDDIADFDSRSDGLSNGHYVEKEDEEEKRKKKELMEHIGLPWERKKGKDITLKELEKIEDIASRTKKTDTKIDGEDIESIKVLGDGSFEVNLKSLINEKGVIISVGESGRYIIDLQSFLEENEK